MMRQEKFAPTFGDGLLSHLGSYVGNFPRRTAIGIILLVALFAFEMFNFDTTRYALNNLLGSISFAGLGWATILAIAFCAIDFAGLMRLFTPDSNGEQPKEVWYLMGAWLLGATMNALMTWWAVSLTLLNHDFGNEVLGREQLLQIVPIFVAVLVWLTRILFIGAITVAGEHLLQFGGESVEQSRQLPLGQPKREPRRPAVANGRPLRANGNGRRQPAQATVPHVSDEMPGFLRDGASGKDEERPDSRPGLRKVEDKDEAKPVPSSRRNAHRSNKKNGRVRQRPPMPGMRPASLNASARKRN